MPGSEASLWAVIWDVDGFSRNTQLRGLPPAIACSAVTPEIHQACWSSSEVRGELAENSKILGWCEEPFIKPGVFKYSGHFNSLVS